MRRSHRLCEQQDKSTRPRVPWECIARLCLGCARTGDWVREGRLDVNVVQDVVETAAIGVERPVHRIPTEEEDRLSPRRDLQDVARRRSHKVPGAVEVADSLCRDIAVPDPIVSRAPPELDVWQRAPGSGNRVRDRENAGISGRNRVGCAKGECHPADSRHLRVERKVRVVVAEEKRVAVVMGGAGGLACSVVMVPCP